jgi:hypothetical protein
MDKSIFQNLSESLEKEIFFLKKEINHKISLLEAAPTGGGEKLPPTLTVGDPIVPSNQGFVAGLYGSNADTVVQNPNVISAVRKEKQQDKGVRADRAVAPYKPLTNNIGMGMGFGQDDWTFNQTKNFINQHAEIDDIIAQTDDPEQTTYLSWKQVNNAVGNYTGKTLKGILNNWGLVTNAGMKAYDDGVGDKYSVYIPDLALRKKVEDIAHNMMGKPKGAQVNLKLAQIYR